jgi:hypothetical protein
MCKTTHRVANCCHASMYAAMILHKTRILSFPIVYAHFWFHLVALLEDCVILISDSFCFNLTYPIQYEWGIITY